MRLIHYQENSIGKTTPMIQLPPTRSLPQHMGIQDEIWVGTQPNHTILPLAPLNFISSHFKDNHAFPIVKGLLSNVSSETRQVPSAYETAKSKEI